MPIVVVPEVLREKLGDEGSKALVELLKSVQEETKVDAIALVEERFTRRLTEEIGKLRAEIYREMGKLRAELTEKIEETKTELCAEINGLRSEMNEKFAAVYRDMEKLRTEIHSMRADMIKWMFVFWITQMLTLIGIVIALVKFVG